MSAGRRGDNRYRILAEAGRERLRNPAGSICKGANSSLCVAHYGGV